MRENLVCLSPSELALWLGLSADAVEKKIGERLREGSWRMVASADAGGPDRVELPVADLNVEIDARYEVGATASKTHDETADLAAKDARIRELTVLLGQAERAIEAARLDSETQLTELEAAGRLNLRLSAEAMSAKSALIAAYDKIIDLQQQLVEARDGLSCAREDAAAIESIAAIIGRMKHGRR